MLHVHHTMRGIFIGSTEDRTADGRLKIDDKFYYRNEGRCQYVGGPKKAQSLGGKKTVKTGVLTRHPRLDETRLYSLRKDLAHLYEELGTFNDVI